MTQGGEPNPKNDEKNRGAENGEPVEQKENLLPLTLLHPALLYRRLLEVKDGIDAAALEEIKRLAEDTYRQAYDTLAFAPLVNWGERLKDRLSNPLVLAAFSDVRRFDFMWEDFCLDVQLDRPLPIPGKQTISQPTLVANMLDKLDLERGQKILDIGSGSGWTTALMAHAVGEEGKVVGKERIEELVEFGQANLAKYDFPWAHIEQAGSSIGDPSKAPFDRILVSAQLKREWVQLLINQLSPNGGILITPIVSEESYGKPNVHDQSVVKITRNGDSVEEEVISENTSFVPIIFTPVNGQATILAANVVHLSGKK